jgi:hypothetical protein
VTRKCPRRANIIVGGLLPADKRLLQHILGIGHAPQHAIRNGEEQAAILVEGREPDRIGPVLLRLRLRRTEMIFAPQCVLFPTC